MVAMAGMLFAGLSIFTALGIGAIMVVAVAMIGSVTVLPAVLSSLGDRVEKGRIPSCIACAATRARGRVWGWILGKVLKRPAVSAAVATGLLVAMTLPAFGMHTVLSGTDDYSRKMPVMQVYDRMQASFPGGQIPAVVDIEANDVTTPQIAKATKALGDKAFATGKMNGPLSVEVSHDKHVASISIPMQGNGTDTASTEALAALRGGIVQSTIGSAPGVQHAYVTGTAAGTKDFNDLMKRNAPIVFAFVLSLAFLLLLVTFRSIVIPIKAIALNLLSVGAAYGILTWIFQDGPLREAARLPLKRRDRGLAADVPVRDPLRALDGLPRVHPHPGPRGVRSRHEDRGRGRPRHQGHGRHGHERRDRHGRRVRMFATESGIEIKELGIGLALAILIDATIVRAVLLPATMKLLGKWNWYLPSKLNWLPELSHEPTLDVAPAPA